MNNATRTRTTRTLLALAGATVVGAVLTIGSTSAGAAPQPYPLFVSGSGLWELDGGDAVVEGPGLVNEKHGRELLDMSVSARLAADDGTLPAPDTCEPASATFVVDGPRDSDMTIAGTGTACAVRNPFAPQFVSIRFTGQHTVVEARRTGLEGTAGSMEMTLTSANPGGFTSIYADSFVPTA